MDPKEIAEVKGLVGVAAALGKGPKFLSEWMAKRTEQRYTEFIDAARDGNVFPENAERMTPDDLFAILRSPELDIENEKAMLYGRLASSIAKGDMSAHDRRHFIKSLRELTFSQVCRLRRAHVAAEFALKPTIGSGRKEMREYIAGGPSGRLDEAAFKQFTLTDGDKLTDIGIRLVIPPPISRRQKWNFLVPFPEEVP
ncbi:hypothetical protein LPY96_01255 [Xanthomonas citri pv. malvacearum]|uniref:hypothetical protein n=1 Tax=Xanthomonas citri TaxID=346 RepID=UPI0022B06843|nr:hypothetical protein [Xanthomonas citri]WAW87197.1 hypothetical protein LPY96_01255 [Xanthomonas citri pv. malvacearum]